MKNKKSIIVLIIFLLMIIVGAIHVRAYNTKRISNIKILDCYQNEIENYKENTMPFTIEKYYENAKIYINGKNIMMEKEYTKLGNIE